MEKANFMDTSTINLGNWTQDDLNIAENDERQLWNYFLVIPHTTQKYNVSSVLFA